MAARLRKGRGAADEESGLDDSEDGPSPEQAEELAALIGRGIHRAMKTEDFGALTDFLVGELPMLLVPEMRVQSAEALRSLAWNLGRSIWNVTPLPSQGYRPRPVPAPERNEACPCGSGRKFKKCCGLFAHEFPTIPEEGAWEALAGQIDVRETARLLEAPALPANALAPLAKLLEERGESRRAARLLGKALAEARELDARHEDAVLLLLDLELERNGLPAALARAEKLLPRLPSVLRGPVYAHLASSVADTGDLASARDLFEQARREAPDNPGLAPLEVMLTLEEGDLPQASERARFWLAWMRRRGLADEMPDAVEFLEQAARDPEAARADLQESTVTVTPVFTEALRELVANASRRPVRPYPLPEAGGSLVFSPGPKGVDRITGRWRRVWRVEKPLLSSLDVDPPVWMFKEPDPWLDLLRRHPAAFDSLDVLDDLVLVLASLPEHVDARVDEWLLAPLLERAVAIVRSSLAARPARLVEWGFTDNRSALRLLTQAGLRLDHMNRAGEAAELFEWVLRLNPSDNQGHRGWLVNHYLRTGEDERALAVSLHHEDDALVDTCFGRALALWRLGRLEEANAQLSATAKESPRTARALVAAEMREPDMSPYGITIGGEDEAWIYRVEMLEVWRATPAALEFLAALPIPEPADPRPPRKGKHRRKRRAPDAESF